MFLIICVTLVYIQADDLYSTVNTLVPHWSIFLCPSSSSSTSSSLPSEWLSVAEGNSSSEAALGLKGTFQPGQTHSGLAAWLRNMGHRLTLGGPCQSQPSGASNIPENDGMCSTAYCNKTSMLIVRLFLEYHVTSK